MNLRKLLTDREAVSPVIGVILMVAVTVVLAAVIATFVLSTGSQVSDSPPEASFDPSQETFDFVDPNPSAPGGVTKSYDIVVHTHTNGAEISNQNLELRGPTEFANETLTNNPGSFNGIVDFSINETEFSGVETTSAGESITYAITVEWGVSNLDDNADLPITVFEEGTRFPLVWEDDDGNTAILRKYELRDPVRIVEKD